MDQDDVISISSEDEREHDDYGERQSILEPLISNVVESLGGFEGHTYRMGDEAYGCLKDLKKYWRKDDTDDERTVARIFWKTRVLPNDLIPILLETAGKGHVEDKRAIACADLVTAMTWPIDLAEELKELDEEYDRGADYTQLLQSHLHYKAALLRPGVMQALFNILLPCLAKDKKERKERDEQIINVVLHLVRNLAFIKDLPTNVHLSADQADFSSLQSKLIRTLADTHYLELLTTIASNAATDNMFNNWNTLVLEIFYLLFRGVKPAALIIEPSKQATKNLHTLLSIENKRRRDWQRNAPSRHSRFGTTISVTLNPKKSAKREENGVTPAAAEPSSSSQAFVLHRQQALNKEAGSIIDLVKRQKARKGQKLDELGREDNLSVEAKSVLQNLASTFIESCFNPFLASLLKDIKSERAKITEKDNIRLLFVTKWFLEFFLATRSYQKTAATTADVLAPPQKPWNFGFVGEVVERAWISWVLKRMRGAVEEKPKLWTELQGGIECLTQLLALIEAMSASKASSSTIATATRDPFDPQSVLDAQEEEDAAALQEAAEVLQQQLIYNGEIMDAAMEGLRAYKEGTQAIAFLQSSVGLAYALMRMLERWGKNKGDGAYVRRRSKPKKKRKAKNGGEDAGVPDGEEEDAEAEKEEITETMFTFEAFEAKFADPNITASLVTYLARYEDFKSPDSMKQVVSLMHRQAVRAKAEGLYFQVSTLDLFKTIVANQRSLPKDQPYKDLVALINYILRQFFKAVEADSFVLIEAFFPKTRGQWKKLSSWEPEAKTKKPRATVDESRFPPDVQVKKGYTWSEQLAIAMAALTEDGKEELIDWVKVILSLVIAQRRRIIEDVDGDSEKNPEAAEDEQSQLEDDEELKARTQAKGASAEALAKITDYLIPYISDEQAEAATKNAQLKLMFRLVKFFILDEDAEELEWYIPAAVLVSDLQQSLNVIEQFQKSPLDLDGKRASELLRKKTRRRTRRRAPSGSDAEGSDGDEDEPRVKKRKERKKKETQVYKSAQFVQDSDEEYDKGIDEFFEKERQLRERAALTAANHALGIGTMKKTGSKKRRRRNLGKEGDLKRRRAGGGDEDDDDDDAGGGDDNMLAAELSPAASVSAASDAELEDRVSPASPFSQAVSPLPAGPTSTAPPSDDDEPIARAKPKPRPRPRPKTRTTRADSSPTAIEGERLPNSSVGEAAAHAATEKLVSDVQATAEHDSDDEDAEESDANLDRSRAGVVKRKGRLVLSDEPDE